MYCCGNSFYRYMNNPFMGGCFCNTNPLFDFMKFSMLSNMINSMFAMPAQQWFMPQMSYMQLPFMPQMMPSMPVSVFSFVQPSRMPKVIQHSNDAFNTFNTIINKTKVDKTTAPKEEALKTKVIKTEAAKTETPKTETPKAETPKTEVSRTKVTKSEAPKAPASKGKVFSKTEYVKIACNTAKKYGVDERLVLAVIYQESKFKNNLTSPAGAQGLMQLMPATAKDLGVTNPMDPVQNIDGGVRLLKKLLDRYNGDVKKALAAYNWGPGNVNKYLAGKKSMPKETQNYIKIADNYKNFSVA